MSDCEPYIKYVKIPVNDGRGYYMLTQEYFATCTVAQFKSMLKQIRYSAYLFSKDDANKVFNFIQQGIINEINLYDNYSGYVTKKRSLKKKLEILNEERGLYYDV